MASTIRIFRCGLAACLIVAPAMTAAAQGDRPVAEVAAEQVVDLFFRNLATQAAATRHDLEDDARVEHWQHRCAIYAHGIPAVQAELYSRLIVRAQQRRDGEDAALRYRVALARAQPRHRLSSPVQLAAAYREAYEAAPRSQREPLAEPYIEVLIRLAQSHERRWNIDAALAAQREALSVARAARSPYRALLEDYGRTLGQLSQAAHRLGQLERQAQTDPAAARTFALRCVAYRSDFGRAIPAAQASGDDALVGLLELAAKPVLDLEPMQVLAVAQMFHAMADDPALELDAARLVALQEAQFYYQHFLFAYPLRDVVRLTAGEKADTLGPRIDALRPVPMRRPAGPWFTLTNGIAEPRVGNSGNLVRGKHLRVRNNTVYAHRSAFTIPASPDESYDFRMAITLTHANDRQGMSLYFPIGAREGGRLVLGEGGEASCRIVGLDPIERLAGFRFPEDQPVGMTLGVHTVGGGNVHLTLTLEGTEVLNWTGPIHALRVDNGDRPPRAHGNIFRVWAGTTYQFQQIEVRRAAEE